MRAVIHWYSQRALQSHTSELRLCTVLHWLDREEGAGSEGGVVREGERSEGSERGRGQRAGRVLTNRISG